MKPTTATGPTPTADPPDHYDDPLATGAMPDAAEAPEPIPTGLSDEEDAQRHLALRFNHDLLFCINCEVHYERQVQVYPGEHRCPRCTLRLWRAGTPPLGTKRKVK